jgi:phage-related protein
MSNWSIHYFNETVQEEILSFPDSLAARYVRLTNLMLIEGAHLGMPYTKAMGNGLFELRLQGKDCIGRVMYCTLINQQIVMLHSFIKKTQKTPKCELDIAIKRMNEVKRRVKP